MRHGRAKLKERGEYFQHAGSARLATPQRLTLLLSEQLLANNLQSNVLAFFVLTLILA